MFKTIKHGSKFVFVERAYFRSYRTGLTWTYRRPYAHTRWQLWGSNARPLGSEAWPLNHCVIGADNKNVK